MFAGYQSSQQSNIVNNNINSSVSNSTAITSELDVDQQVSSSAVNAARGKNFIGSGNCSVEQNIDVTQKVSQDISAISKIN